jgi:rubredoxin
MRLIQRLLRREPPQETKCPRCGVPAPPEDLECNVCGWDLRESYHNPKTGTEAEPEKVERSELSHRPRGL